MKDEIRGLLGNLMSEEEVSEIMDNMDNQTDESKYKIGDIFTVSELKALPEGSIIHLWYIGNSGELRNNEFVEFDGYQGNDELRAGGWAMPTKYCTDDELMDHLDNSGWTFTVRKAIQIIN